MPICLQIPAYVVPGPFSGTLCIADRLSPGVGLL